VGVAEWKTGVLGVLGVLAKAVRGAINKLQGTTESEKQGNTNIAHPDVFSGFVAILFVVVTG